MEFALQTMEGSFDRFVDVARWAENAGLAAFSMPDHYLSGTDITRPVFDTPTVLAALARETTRIELSALVSPITFRHPAVLAKVSATMHEISAGRFVLGLGTGWMKQEHEVWGLPFPPRAERFAMLSDALGYLRAVFADPPTGFTGAHYRFEGIDHRPRPALRIMVGGSGLEETPRLAGTYADEYNVVGAGPDGSRERIERVRSAAVAAGRDPDAIRMGMATILVVGETRAEYRAALDRTAARLARDPADLESALAGRDAPMGTFDQARAALGRYEAIGITRCYIQTLGDTDIEALTRAVSVLG